MKRIVAVLVFVGLAMISGTSALAGRALVGKATELFPVDKTVQIGAEITFFDTGSSNTGLIVKGEAKGLDPANTYVTLVYNIGSVAKGPNACSPTNSILDPTQMLVGFWKVENDGSGELFALKFGKSYAALKDIGTTSIRVVQGPPPSGFVLQACGEIGQFSVGPRPEPKVRSRSGTRFESAPKQLSTR